MELLKTSILSTLVAGTAIFAADKPADAQVYFGFGTGGYHSPGYYGGPQYGHGHYGGAYHGGFYGQPRFGHQHYGYRDFRSGRGFDWDDGDFRRAERRRERAHRRFHRQLDRRFDWDD